MRKSSFSPKDHLSIYHDANGQPIFENIEIDGRPQVSKGSDGRYRSLMAPKRYLSANAYREWFYDVYPEGSIVVDDLSLPAAFNGTVFVESLEFKVKVTLYEDREQKKQISCSYGILKKNASPDFRANGITADNSDMKSSFELAQSIALKNAMLNAGFIFDFSEADMTEATYVDEVIEGPILNYAPSAEIEDSPVSEAILEIKKPAPAEDDLFNYLSEKAELEKVESDEIITKIPVAEPKEDPREAAKNVIFTALDSATDHLKRFNGLRLGDIEEGMITYFTTRDWTGKLSPETIAALEILG